jgi:hypothetical protein
MPSLAGGLSADPCTAGAALTRLASERHTQAAGFGAKAGRMSAGFAGG